MRRLDISDLLLAAPDAATAEQGVLHELLRALPGVRALFDAARALAPSPAETLTLSAEHAMLAPNASPPHLFDDLSAVSGPSTPCSVGALEVGQGCARGCATASSPGKGGHGGSDVAGLPGACGGGGRVSWAPRQWQLLALLRACGACQGVCIARVHAAMAQARPARKALHMFKCKLIFCIG